MVTRVSTLLFALGAVLACQPEDLGGVALIEGPRVLAVRSEPAEVAPGKDVTLSALFVDRGEAPDPSGMQWSLCNLRKPIAVTGSIAPACLVPEAEGLVPLGFGESVKVKLPMDDCRVFGPNTPAPKPGEPAARPADPDSTGGYYHPLRIFVPKESGGNYVVAATRLSCGLAGATQEQTAEYTRNYRPNQNPNLLVTLMNPGFGETELSSEQASPTTVSAGAAVKLLTVWEECPVEASCGDGYCTLGETSAECAEDCMSPKPCAGSEPYLAFDPVDNELRQRRESMRVSWFSDAGSWAHDRSGRTEEDASIPYSDNVWTAPSVPGEVKMWVVLRDDRGGVGFSRYFFRVE